MLLSRKQAENVRFSKWNKAVINNITLLGYCKGKEGEWVTSRLQELMQGKRLSVSSFFFFFSPHNLHVKKPNPPTCKSTVRCGCKSWKDFGWKYKNLSKSYNVFHLESPGAVLNALYSSHLTQTHLTFKLSCINQQEIISFETQNIEHNEVKKQAVIDIQLMLFSADIQCLTLMELLLRSRSMF